MEKIEFYHYILEDRDSCIIIKKKPQGLSLDPADNSCIIKVSLYSNISKSVIFYYERSLSFCVNCVTHSACGVLA